MKQKNPTREEDKTYYPVLQASRWHEQNTDEDQESILNVGP